MRMRSRRCVRARSRRTDIRRCATGSSTPYHMQQFQPTCLLLHKYVLVFRGFCMQALLVSVPLVAPLPGAAAAAPAVPAAVLPLAAAPEVKIEVAVEPGAMFAFPCATVSGLGMQDLACMLFTIPQQAHSRRPLYAHATAHSSTAHAQAKLKTASCCIGCTP